MENIIITNDVQYLFPDLAIGVVTATIGKAKGDVRATVTQMRTEALASLREKAPDQEALNVHPNVTVWREAYQKFGFKPRAARASHEAFARRLLKADAEPTFPDINDLVDIYLINQTATLLPHGGFDTTLLVGDLFLKVSPGDEPFVTLSGESEPTVSGEVVYADSEGARIITRVFNWRDGQATGIRPETTQMVLLIESPSSGIPAEGVEAAAHDLARRYQACFEGEFNVRMVRLTEGQTRYPLA